MSDLKQQILKDVAIATKNNIKNTTKNNIVSCLRSHINTLFSKFFPDSKNKREKPTH